MTHLAQGNAIGGTAGAVAVAFSPHPWLSPLFAAVAIAGALVWRTHHWAVSAAQNMRGIPPRMQWHRLFRFLSTASSERLFKPGD